MTHQPNDDFSTEEFEAMFDAITARLKEALPPRTCSLAFQIEKRHEELMASGNLPEFLKILFPQVRMLDRHGLIHLAIEMGRELERRDSGLPTDIGDITMDDLNNSKGDPVA